MAEKAGFAREQIADLILAGAAASPIVKIKLPRMIARDFEAMDFALYLMLKDTRYAAALAQSLGAPAYMVSGATRAFARAEAEGLGDKDFSAVGRGEGRLPDRRDEREGGSRWTGAARRTLPQQLNSAAGRRPLVVGSRPKANLRN